MNDGNITMRLVGGWPLGTLPASEEPRVRDLDLAERLGYERPRKIRELIARLEEQGKIGEVSRRPTVGLRGFAEGIIEEAWLTEEQALLVTTQSETPKAWEVTREVLQVFRLAVRGLLPDQAPYTRENCTAWLVNDAMAAGKPGAAVAYLNALRCVEKGQLSLVDVGPAREPKTPKTPKVPADPPAWLPALREVAQTYMRERGAVPCGRTALAAKLGHKQDRMRIAVRSLLDDGSLVCEADASGRLTIRVAAPIASGDLQ